MIFGCDVSTYQGGGFDFPRARQEGMEFAIIRAWDRRTNAVDSQFYRNLDAARGAGMIVAAYHFIVPWEDGATNADHVLRTIPEDVPIILDVEMDQASGATVSIGLAQDIANRLRGAGRRLPLAYVPKWYWRDHMGQPDLRGLSDHGLWASRYASAGGGTPQQIYGSHYPDGWDAYGGAGVAMLQFTSKSTIAGITPVDSDAFLGTREELAALLGEDDMFSDDDKEKLRHIQVQFTGNPWNKSAKDGPFLGWPSFADPNVRATWVTFMLALDNDLYRNMVKLSAIKTKLEETNAQLAKGGATFDKDAFLAKVKENAKQRAAAEIYELTVKVGPKEPTA